jgi:threonine/homoserine/homoserine lactone efflux protein
MTELLPPWPLFLTFLGASLVLAITPGPGVLYIVTRSLSQGKRSGLVSVAGVALGNLGNALAAALGLGVVLASSPTAFMAIKYVGAAYLVYLGIRTLLGRLADPAVSAPVSVRLRAVFRDGLVVALFNPKTALFFAAFLPQFIQPGTPALAGTLVLAVMCVAIAASTDAIYAVTAGGARRVLSSRPAVRSLGRYAAGGTYLGLGIMVVRGS